MEQIKFTFIIHEAGKPGLVIDSAELPPTAARRLVEDIRSLLDYCGYHHNVDIEIKT